MPWKPEAASMIITEKIAVLHLVLDLSPQRNWPSILLMFLL